MASDDKVLLRRYHEQGDLQAKEELIERYMSLVRSLARRYSYRGEQLDDLVQIGAIGLIKAIDRFDLERGVELTTYATPNIIGEIKRHFRDKGWSVRVPRGLQELNVQISKLIEQLTVQLSRSPTIPGSPKRPRSRRKPCSKRSRAVAPTAPSRCPTGAGSEDDSSSTRSSRSRTKGTNTRSRRIAPCSHRGSRCSTSASAASSTSVLPWADAVADRQADRDFPDARVEAHPALAREDPRGDRRGNRSSLTAAMHVREWGSPEERPLVFWHALGAAQSGAYLTELAPTLTEAGLRLIAPDARLRPIAAAAALSATSSIRSSTCCVASLTTAGSCRPW